MIFFPASVYENVHGVQLPQNFRCPLAKIYLAPFLNIGIPLNFNIFSLPLFTSSS